MTNVTPIRKPNHKQKFELNSYRRIARLANARVVACGSKYYLFEGFPPDFDEVYERLVELTKSRAASGQSILSVARLTCQFSELSNSFLNAVSQNLNRWEARVRNPKSGRGKNKVRKSDLKEIEDIASRLRQLATILKHPNQTEEPQFLLLPPESREFDSITAQHAGKFDELQSLLLKMVYWFRGPGNTRQFLASLLRLNSYRNARIKELESIRDKMQQILRHTNYVNSEFAIRELEQEDLFQRTAKIVRQRQKWKGFSSSKSCHHNLAAAIKAYTRTINKTRYAIDVFAPVSIASHFIATDSAVEFPSAWIDQFVRSEFKLNLTGRARFATQFSHRRGYKLLTPLLNNDSMPSQVRFLRHCVSWLESGASLEDMEFAAKIWPHTRFGSDVRLKRLRIATTRLAELFDWNIVATSEFVTGLLKKPMGMESIDSLIHCLRRFPTHLVPDIRERLIGVMSPFLFDDYKTITIDTKPFEAAIVQWSSKWRDDDPRMKNEAELPKQLRIWSRRLARFQTQNDQEAAIPASITKLLNTAENRQQELNYLRQRSEEGQLNDRMQQRLNYLEQPNPKQEKHIAKAIRATQSACLVVGIEALRHQLIQVARSCLKSKFHVAAPKATSLHDLVMLGGWTDRMTAQELSLLRETTNTWLQFGDDYKQHLKFNQHWLMKARANRLDLNAWLNPVEQTRIINTKRFRLFISRDPYQVYSMGNLFNTCLSHGGCNEMSVLANAAHANKQVIFVADERDRLVARKLIAISSEYQLLGYHEYSVFTQDHKHTHNTIVDWMSLFGRQLCRDVGLKLTEEGEPESINGHFWYDDGSVGWPAPVDLACGTIDCVPGFVPQGLLPPMLV